MSLKDSIENVMLTESYNTRLTGIADLVGASDDDVRNRMKTLDFGKYIELMRALRDRDEKTAKEVLGFSLDEEYSTGSQGTRTSLTPGEMKGMQQAQSQAQASAPSQDSSSSAMTKKAQAMQRLGKKALGGISGQQAAKALDRAEQGKALTPVQRAAMAQQAKSIDALASNPKTAQQFRSLLNKLNK